MRNAAQAMAEFRRLTIMPKVTSPTAKLPFLIALHGNGSRAKSELGYWTPATEKGWLLTLPQSTQVETPNGFSWWDRNWAVREALHHIDEVTSEHPVDSDRMVIGGFSAGAGLAIRLALGGELTARGFIAVAPALQTPEEIRSLLKANVPNQLRGYLIVGDRDQRASTLAQTAKSLFGEYGIPCELETHPNMGHSYPHTFHRSLNRALEFIMSD
ncbi:MAG: dienelactone hydrolase family protein [Thermaerobacter sp.]|nr:dienelactone hydrolase family protein [Thermaerobacter sp.]